jgi:hypothetical protein
MADWHHHSVQQKAPAAPLQLLKPLLPQPLASAAIQ